MWESPTQEAIATFSGALQPNDALDVRNWRLRKTNKDRIVTSAAATGTDVFITTTLGDPDVGPDELEYTATYPDLRDAAGLLIPAQGPVPLT